jgi:hypothetical protein
MRARSAAWRSAWRLPGDPLTPTMIRRTPDTVLLLPNGTVYSKINLGGRLCGTA